MPRTDTAPEAPAPEPKHDLRKELAGYSAARGRFEILTVPARQFLTIDGSGDPNTSTAYGDAIRTLYPVAYGLKFLSRNDLGRDHGVMPLEALWWADDMESFTAARDKSAWHWTAMILVPDWIHQQHFDAVLATVRRTGRAPATERIRLEVFDEGLAAQTLHVGPYDDEGPVIQRMHEEFIPERGCRLSGKHHEIYLSDARRTAPARLRTILRQPVAVLP